MSGVPEVVLGEWDSTTVEVGEPTETDLRLTEDLQRTADGKVSVTWLHGGNARIVTKAWIGVVRLGSFTLRVVPKYAGDELGVVRMLAHTSGLSRLKRISNERPPLREGSHLLELLCQLLVEEAGRLVTAGLVRDYVGEEDDLPRLRGRLDARRQGLRHHGRFPPLACRFDEYHGDVDVNRFVAAGLMATQRLSSVPATRRRARRALTDFLAICEPVTADPDHYERSIKLDRRTLAYASAHHLSGLILRSSGINDLHSTGAVESFAFLIDMNRLFEDFITSVIEQSLRGAAWRVDAQRQHRGAIWDLQRDASYKRIIPDLVLTRRGPGLRTRVPMDVKYKLYDQQRIANDDLYQTFLYAHTLGEPRDDLVRAGIIYAARTTHTGPTLAIRTTATEALARVTGIGISVPDMLDALDGDERSMDELFSELRGELSVIVGQTVS